MSASMLEGFPVNGVKSGGRGINKNVRTATNEGPNSRTP